MHPNCGTNDSVQLLPFIRLVSLWSIFGFDWVDLTIDYWIVLQPLLPEIEVQCIELSKLISNELDVDAIFCRFFRPTLLRVTTTMRGTYLTGLTKCRLIE